MKKQKVFVVVDHDAPEEEYRKILKCHNVIEEDIVIFFKKNLKLNCNLSHEEMERDIVYFVRDKALFPDGSVSDCQQEKTLIRETIRFIENIRETTCTVIWTAPVGVRSAHYFLEVVRALRKRGEKTIFHLLKNDQFFYHPIAKYLLEDQKDYIVFAKDTDTVAEKLTELL